MNPQTLCYTVAIAGFLNPPLRIKPQAGTIRWLLFILCVRCTQTFLKVNCFSNEILDIFTLIIVVFAVQLLLIVGISKSVNDSFIVPCACPKSSAPTWSLQQQDHPSMAAKEIGECT